MKSIVCFLLAWGASGWATADMSAIQRCRVLQEPAARLACYDAIVLPSMSQSPDTGSSATPRAPASERTDGIAPSMPGPVANPAQTFGMESRVAPMQELPALESAIQGPFDGWVARQRFKLANGQVWEISDGSQAAYDLRDPKVKITRGMSGAFFMQIEGVAQFPRVRRIE